MRRQRDRRQPAGALQAVRGALARRWVLAIAKSVDRDVVDPGGAPAYTLDVRNDGRVPAMPVTVRDTLPEGLTFVTATWVGAAGAVGGPALLAVLLLVGGVVLVAVRRRRAVRPCR